MLLADLSFGLWRKMDSFQWLNGGQSWDTHDSETSHKLALAQGIPTLARLLLE